MLRYARHLALTAFGCAAVLLVGCRTSEKAQSPSATNAPAPVASIPTRDGGEAASDRRTAARLPAGDLFYLDRCPQCQSMLGSAGIAVVRIDENRRQLRFCTDTCADRFDADRPASLDRLDQKLIEDQRPYYPSETCVVTGRSLDARSVEFICRNRLVRVADAGARGAFEREPERWWRVLDEAAIKRHAPGYAVKKCPVQGVALDVEVDDETTVVCANRLVRTCCKDCAELVRAMPSHFVPLIDSANRMLAPKR